MTGHEFEEFGPYQDFYMSIVAQQRETCGDLGGAAWVYEILASRPEPFEGLRSSILFGLRAAKLYRSIGETGKAENVLVSLLREHPENVKTLQELLKVQVDRSDLNAALPLGERLSTLTGQENWTPETRLLMVMRQFIVSQAAVDEEAQKWPPFAGLCPSSRKAFETALLHHLEAIANQSRRDSYVCTAALYFSKAVECQLRKKVFEPFRVQILNSQPRDPLINKRGEPDKFLNVFVDDEGNGITLRQMVNSMKFVRTLSRYVQKHFPRLLSAEILGKLNRLVPLRNAETHDTLDPQLAAQARELAESVIEAMN